MPDNPFIIAVRPIFLVLFFICEFNVLYYAILSIVGLFAHKQKYPMVDDKQKFVIFVPCHNEGPVVESTVENYTHIEYDPKLFEIYFIADNCSDNTADILRAAVAKLNFKNFHVLERHDPDPNKRGKPHALKWGIDTLQAQDHFYNHFDMFMILDADNFVDPGILKHINSQYLSYKPNKRPVMLQSYLDSKNSNTMIARGYYITYRFMNAFWQLPKQKLHLVPGIGGTGFAMDIKFLESLGGFNCTSLTEDLEIQVMATIRNKNIVFNKNVRVYDEKPTKLKASMVQRTRWAQGHWYLFFKYFPRLFIQLFNPKTIKNFFKKIDVMVYLSSRLFVMISVISILFSLGMQIYIWCNGYWTYVLLPLELMWLFWVNIGLFVLSVLAVPLSVFWDGKPHERKRVLLTFIPNLLSLYLISIIDMIVGFPGLFKCHNQKVWKKTAHNLTNMSTAEERHKEQ